MTGGKCGTSVSTTKRVNGKGVRNSVKSIAGFVQKRDGLMAGNYVLFIDALA
jgi:hypothetical protein